MIEINLLPAEILEQRKKRDFVIFVGICGVVALGICYLFYLSLSQSIYPLEQRLEELNEQITQYQPVLQEIEKIKRENEKIQARFNAFKQVVIRQSFWPLLLYEIYRSLPDTIWLSEIKSNIKEGYIEIKGNSLNQTIGVAQFITEMEKSELFSEIDFIKFSQQVIADKQVMLFQLKCFLSDKIKG